MCVARSRSHEPCWSRQLLLFRPWIAHRYLFVKGALASLDRAALRLLLAGALLLCFGITMVEHIAAASTASTDSLPILGTDDGRPTSLLKRPSGMQTKPTKVAEASNVIIEATSSVSLQNGNTGMSTIWQEVLGDNLEKLSTKDKAYCSPLSCNTTITVQSLESVFEPLRKKYEKDAFYKFLERINPILEQVQSFGRASNVAVGGGDTGAGILWGGMKALLLVRRTHCQCEPVLTHALTKNN